MFLLFLAIGPVAIILAYIYALDKYEKEPLLLCFKTTFWGAVIVIPIILVELVLAEISSNILWQSFIVAAVTEEAFKFLVVYKIAYKRAEFNEPFDGIIYAVFASLGFATVENIFYVLDGGAGIAILQAATAVPAHSIFGVRMGFFFGLAKFSTENEKNLLQKAILVPILLHGVYDYIVMSGNGLLLALFIPYLIYLYKLAFRLMKEHSMFRPLKIRTIAYLELKFQKMKKIEIVKNLTLNIIL